MEKPLKTPTSISDPFENFQIEYGIEKLPTKFSWKTFTWKDRWQVIEGMPLFNVKGNKYYYFDTEEQANEFVMLKKFEQ